MRNIKQISSGPDKTWEQTKDNLNANFALLSFRGASNPLDIPTYDNNPSVTHPDVIYIPGGFAGYSYWMSFTPYPAADRENPSIVASNDKINWEVPEGLENPIFSVTDAAASGYSYWSDASLCYHDGTLYMYFRGAGGTNEGIFVTKSTDGITWSPRELLFAKTAPGSAIMSPSVIHDGDNFVMHTVNFTNLLIERRVSETYNGFVVGSPATCVFPTGDYKPWHIDVALCNGSWFSLIATHYNGSDDKARLIFFVSDDGITWEGDIERSVPVSGEPWDSRGHYRSSIVPVVGNNIVFDVYVASYMTGDTEWRIGLIKQADLLKRGLIASEYANRLIKSSNNILIPAINFRAYSGAVVKDTTGTWYSYYGFELEDTADNTIVACIPPWPATWQGVDAYLIGYWATAPTVGQVVNFSLIFCEYVDGMAKSNSGLTVMSAMPYTITEGDANNNITEILLGRKSGPFKKDSLFTSIQIKRLIAGNTVTAHFVFIGLKLVAYEAPYVSPARYALGATYA